MKINLSDKIGLYFTWHEALYLPRYSVHHEPSDVEIQNIIALSTKLQEVCKYFNIPFHIDCWIRPTNVKGIENNQFNGTDYNALVKGATKSQHILGSAVDFLPVGMSVDDFLSKLEPLLPKFQLSAERNGSKVGRNWIHLDNMQRGGIWKMYNP